MRRRCLRIALVRSELLHDKGALEQARGAATSDRMPGWCNFRQRVRRHSMPLYTG